MTDPTADAIAALEPFANALYVRQIDGTHVTASPLTTANFRRAREVRSALLSAQGQAGKPVAADADIIADLHNQLHNADERSAELYAPWTARAVAAEARLTTARTALEAAETALEEVRFAQSWSGPFALQLGSVLIQIDSALATIKGLET